MVNTVWVNAGHGRDLHSVADHMTISPRKKIVLFSAFRFSLHLMPAQALTNVIPCLMISQKLHTKVAQPS